MWKFIFFSLFLIGCTHTPAVKYNDPEQTRLENERRSLLIGQWSAQNLVLELKAGGEYILRDLKKPSREEGIWGVSEDIYFNLSKNSPGLYQKYVIRKLSDQHFEFQDQTGKIFQFQRSK